VEFLLVILVESASNGVGLTAARLRGASQEWIEFAEDRAMIQFLIRIGACR